MYSGINISQTDARPMYLQIMEQIRARIAAGDWPPGKELPSIRALAAALNVSVITIKRAYLDLENEGVIVTRHGKGSEVAKRSDLPTALLHVELQRQLAALLATATRLGLGRADLHRLLDDAAPAPPAAIAGTTALPARSARSKGHPS